MAGFFDDTENTTSPVGNSFFDDTEAEELIPDRTVGSTLKDVGISLAKGVVGAGQGVIGLANLPTGGRVGKVLDDIGVKPAEWQKDLSKNYSLVQQIANQKVESTEGFVDTAKTMIENPSTIGHGIVETIPSMLAGGAIGKGALALGTRLAPQAVKSLGTKAAIGAGAIGEGTISAGQTAEEIRNQTQDKLLTAEQSGLAALSGVGTAAFGAIGGLLAKKLGFADVDTMIVSGLNPAKKEGLKSVAKSIIGGGITEGVFEELPQTVQETIFTNAALDKPLLEGVPEGAARAIILGGVMGSGANLMPGKTVAPEKTPAELELERRAGNILSLEKPKLDESVKRLNDELSANQELLNDPVKFDAKVREQNIAPEELIRQILVTNRDNKALLDKINSGIKAKDEQTKAQAKKEYDALSPEEKAVKDAENKLNTKRQEDAIAINDQINTIDEQIANIRKEYGRLNLDGTQKPEDKQKLANDYINLNQEKNKLLDRYKEEVVRGDFAPYTTREERQKFYQSVWGADTILPEIKDAKESASIFQSNTEKLDEIQARIDQERDLNKKADLQNLYNQMFQTFEKDAKESADVYTKELGEVDLVKQTMNQMVQESDPAIRQKLYNQMFILPGVKDAQESAKVFEENASELDQQLANRKQAEGEQFYNDLFAQQKRPFNIDAYNEATTKSAEQSANAFEQAGMGRGQVSAFTDERQVPLTDQQQIIVDRNNFEITKLTDQLNRTIDREERINLLNQIDVLEKDNATIRTSVEQFPQFQTTEKQNLINQVSFADIEKAFPGQTVTKADDGTISVQFKNGKGLTINSIQSAGRDLIELAISTGQMSKNGKILGITIGNKIMLDANFADNKTLWHENKHVLDNLGLITSEDDSALNKEFNKLRNAGKLEFALSTHKDHSQAMVENRANTFAQIMVNREQYRNTAFGRVIQRVMDFFSQLFSFGKQTVSGLAREVESGRVYERQAEALREGMPMFEVREAPSQKISDETYNQMFAERNNLVRTIGQTLRMRGHEIKQLIDKGLGSISTRLKNVDPMLRAEIRNLDFRTAQKIVTALRVAHPLLEKTKQMSAEDKFVWDAARRNSDEVKIKQIADKYGMTADQEKLRSVLNQIRQDAIDVGYDVGFIEEYWPRIIKDQEGFLQATKGISQRPVITDAIKRYADKLGMTVERFEAEYPEQAADIASNTILGRNLGIGGPGNIQARQYETVPPELNKFYMDSDAALMQYIYSMTKKIEARRFFGKVPERIAALKAEKKRKTLMLKETTNAERREELSGDLLMIEQQLDKYKLQRDYTENIGTYINDLRLSGRIQAEDEKTVRDILDARFHEHGTTGPINAYKNMAYIDVMGSPISALTQIGDLAWAMYVGKVWTPRGLVSTAKNLGKAITKKSEITKEDLGIERIAQEFADGTTLSNAVSLVFKKVGLERIDSIGKETLINNAFDNYKVMASTEVGRANLLKQIKPIFGTESEGVINDLLAGNPTDNIKMLLYHRLLDFQPVALSEMPEQYLKSGNGRVFYMLKTYTLKQFDVFRNEAWHNIKNGIDISDDGIKITDKDSVISGITNMIKLASLLTLANAGSDELKDWLLGKDVKFEDHVVENFLTMGGASKHLRMQTTREGLGSGLIGQILPPFKFVNSISKDLYQGYGDMIAGDTINFDHARIVESIPLGGKIYYWHYGRGEDYKKSSNEQEFGNITKDVKLFKRQLENAQDKRTFLNSNLDKFKQMKLHENFQASLNRNQAVINKLKEIPQTTNVRERLGQLQAQRELILKKYFEVAQTVQ